MKPASSKAKGRAFQKIVAAIVCEVDPDTYQMAREKLEQTTLAGRAVAEVSS